MDDLSFLLEAGMPAQEITRLQEAGVSLEEQAEAARRRIERGEMICEPITKPALIKASDVPYEPPRWLIAPYIQRGKGTLIQGENGSGKTAFVCAVAAVITSGGKLLGIPVEVPGDVVLLSVEDDLPVLRGRLEANGADLNRCHFMTNAAGMTFNSPELDAAVRQVHA